MIASLEESLKRAARGDKPRAQVVFLPQVLLPPKRSLSKGINKCVYFEEIQNPSNRYGHASRGSWRAVTPRCPKNRKILLSPIMEQRRAYDHEEEDGRQARTYIHPTGRFRLRPGRRLSQWYVRVLERLRCIPGVRKRRTQWYALFSRVCTCARNGRQRAYRAGSWGEGRRTHCAYTESLREHGESGCHFR